MLIVVLGITLLLFLRSFVGAAEIARQDNLLAAGRAVWGSLFTVLSSTTTGFESRDWDDDAALVRPARSGDDPAGVAVMGGAATTAGGIKLLLDALYRQGDASWTC